MSSDFCPSRDNLAAYVQGTLSEEAVERVADHLDTCPACETTVEDLERQSDPLVDRLRRPIVGNEYQEEAQCQRAVSLAEAVAEASFAVGTSTKKEPALDSMLQSIREYQLLEKLGEGGMGAVYKGSHTKLKRVVALKVLPPYRMQDRQAVARFEREMEAVGKLEHPNVVRALDAGEHEGNHYLVMEYVEGLDLSKLVGRCGPLAMADACEIIRQAAFGLQYIHEHGLVHRDIKPSNLMLSVAGSLREPESRSRSDRPTVKILDLGLALLSSEKDEGTEELTASGQLMGTLDYMAPEQGSDSHEVNIRADIYSLGATLYKLLCGHAPFSGEQFDTPVKKRRALASGSVPPIREHRADVPDGLVVVLNRMLAWDVDQRFATPHEVAEALAEFADGCDLQNLLQAAEQSTRSTVDADKSLGSTDPHVSSAFVDTHTREAAEREAAVQDQNPGFSEEAGFLRPQTAGHRPRRRLVALALGGIAAVIVGVVIYIQTQYGRLVIDAKADDVKIVVQGDGGVTIIDPQRERTVKLWPGKYDVRLEEERAGRSLNTKSFTMKRGGTVTVEVRYEPRLVGTQLEKSKPSEQAGAEKGPKVSATERRPEQLLGWKPGKPISRPNVRLIEIEPEPLALEAGDPLSLAALVSEPASLGSVQSWTVESISHRGAVSHVAFHPANLLLATAGADGTIRLWDPRTEQLVRVLVGHDNWVTSVVWSPDGGYLASSSRDGTVRLWEAASGNLLKVLRGSESPVYCVAWSPDGQTLASGHMDATIRLWDAASGARIAALRGDGRQYQLAWSPGGQRLAVHQEEGRLVLWNVDSGQRSGERMELAELAISTVAWSPDGTALACGCFDAAPTVRLLDAASGERLQTFQGDSASEIRCVAWSPDGKTLAACGFGLVWTWETASAKPLGVVHVKHPEKAEFLSVAWSHDGKILAAGDSDGNIRLWDGGLNAKVRTIRGQTGGLNSVAWSPVGKTVTAGDNDGTVRLWDTSAGGPHRALEGSVPAIMDVAWSLDGKTLATASYVDPWRLWDADTGKCLRTQVPDGTGRAHSVTWSPDDRTLATGDTDGSIRLWNASSGALLRTIQGHKGWVQIAWSPDSKTLAARDRDSLRLWDATSWEQVGTLYEEGSTANCMAWRPDSKVLACGASNQLLLWEAESRQLRFPPRGHHMESVNCVAWSPDGNTIISGDDGAIRLWSGASGELIWEVQEGSRVNSVCWSLDGKIVASGGSNGRLGFREASSGRRLGSYVSLGAGQSMTIDPTGYYRCLPRIEGDLVYVVQTEKGQETLTPGEFGEHYGWKNDPSKVTLGIGAFLNREKGDTPNAAEPTEQPADEAAVAPPPRPAMVEKSRTAVASVQDWVEDQFVAVRISEPVTGPLLGDVPNKLVVEVKNRSSQVTKISRILVEMFNDKAAARLGLPQGAVHRRNLVRETGQPLESLDPKQQTAIVCPGNQILPAQVHVRVFHDLAESPSEFRVDAVGIEIPMNAAVQLPPETISRGLDGLVAIQKAQEKAKQWQDDALVILAFARKREAIHEPNSGLEIVAVETWEVRFCSRTGKAYIAVVTADSVEGREVADGQNDYHEAPFPQVGSQNALEIANQRQWLCANWNGSRLESLSDDVRNPRLRLISIDGQWAHAWFLPYLGPDSVPVVIDATTGDRIQMVDGEFRRSKTD